MIKVRIMQKDIPGWITPTKMVASSSSQVDSIVEDIKRRKAANLLGSFQEKVKLRREGREILLIDGHIRLAAYTKAGYSLLLTPDYELEIS